MMEASVVLGKLHWSKKSVSLPTSVLFIYKADRYVSLELMSIQLNDPQTDPGQGVEVSERQSTEAIWVFPKNK